MTFRGGIIFWCDGGRKKKGEDYDDYRGRAKLRTTHGGRGRGDECARVAARRCAAERVLSQRLRPIGDERAWPATRSTWPEPRKKKGKKVKKELWRPTTLPGPDGRSHSTQTS